jgi:signal transduction histidine kinase
VNTESILKNLLDKIAAKPVTKENWLNNFIDGLKDIVIISSPDGDILYANNAAKNILQEGSHNLRDSGFLFNFESCILDDSIDIANYSPFTVILESPINCTIEAEYEYSPDIKLLYTIKSYYIENTGYLITFSEKILKDYNIAYKDLEETNRKLKEKIKENEQLKSQAQSQAIRESLVNKIATSIRTSLEIDTILQASVKELGKTLGTDSTLLIKNIPGETELPITQEYTVSGKTEHLNQTININNDFYMQEVLDTHRPATGIHTDPGNQIQATKYKLIVPVIHHEELFAILLLIRKNKDWHPEEINLVQSIADQISISIKNARLFEDTTSKNIKISVLNEILKSVNSTLIIDDVLKTIGREIRRLIEFDRASIATLDEKSQQIKLFARIKNTGQVDILRTGPLIISGSAISWAIDNLKPVMLDISNDEQFTDTTLLKKSGIKSAIIIPMINKGVVTGIFYVGSQIENRYSDSDIEIMSQIAGQIAIAVENAKLYWKTQTQALKETLINQIVSSIRKSLKIEDVLNTTVKELGQTLNVKHCLFRYYSEANREYSIYEYSNNDKSSINSNFESFLEDKLNTDTLKNRDITIWKQTDKLLSEDIKSFMEDNLVNTILLTPVNIKDPITHQDREVGIIIIADASAQRDWHTDDLNLLKILTDQITVTVSQAILFEQTQKQKTELEITLKKLKETQAQLIQSEKMASLGQLVAGVAHEINTPVGSIASNNSIFKKCTDKIQKALSEEIADINKIKQLVSLIDETNKINILATDRIKEIVKSLKNFARLDESDLKTVNIHEGIESTLQLIRHELKDKININTRYGDLPPIECYPNLLNQVFMNIIINAYQSITDKGTISISTSCINNSVSVAISDTGSGISEEHMKKLFDPGFTTKGVGVGTGLGLSICYQIIEKHKGQILVDSKPGKGSTFTIVIPVKQET